MAIQNTAKITSQVASQSGDGVEVVTFSNVSEVDKVDTEVKVVKSASKSWVLPEGELTVSTTITNNTNTSIENFKIQDTLVGATFVAGSVKIGSVTHEDLDPIAGFEMQVTLGAGADMTVSYTIKADKMPEDEVIKASSLVTFKLDEMMVTLKSNQEVVEVIFSGLTLHKTAKPSVAIKGTEITYTIEITNDGIRDNSNVIFSDTLPAELSFVDGSITIDGMSQPTYTLDNIQLTDLTPGDSVTVTFRVTVN